MKMRHEVTRAFRNYQIIEIRKRRKSDMKGRKKISSIFLVLVLSFVLVGCGEKATESSDGGSLKEEETNKELAKGVDAPDFTAELVEGGEITLSKQNGKIVLLNFWATWCGPCKRELPAFNNMHAKYGNDVQFMMVNLTDGSVDTVDGVKSFVSDNGYSFPLFLDVEYQCMGAYSISGIPRTIFIASDGNIVYEQVGAISEENLELYTQGLINYN